MQLTQLFPQLDELHSRHGSPEHVSIYGAGEVNQPEFCLVFMNPTGRNVGSALDWQGLRAPWLGTKGVWRLLYGLGLFTDNEVVKKTQALKGPEWTADFAHQVYCAAKKDSLYITNIAKCTQVDVRHIPNSVYKEYLPSMQEELSLVRPKKVIAFGNQVNSVLLEKPISVSNYLNDEFELLRINEVELKVFPTYYPVGQGTRNMPKAVERIKKIVQLKT